MGMRMKLTENDGSTTPSLALPLEGGYLIRVTSERKVVTE